MYPQSWKAQPGQAGSWSLANETVADPTLKAKILERARGPGATILVICPALNSRLKHWFSDDDHARARAAERLDASLFALWTEGLDASGKVGDSDPIVALADALAVYALWGAQNRVPPANPHFSGTRTEF